MTQWSESHLSESPALRRLIALGWTYISGSAIDQERDSLAHASLPQRLLNDKDLSIQPNAVREPEWERVVRLVPKWQRTIDSSKIIGELPVPFNLTLCFFERMGDHSQITRGHPESFHCHAPKTDRPPKTHYLMGHPNQSAEPSDGDVPVQDTVPD